MLETALNQVLAPIARLMIAKGIGFGAAAEHLRHAYIAVAERDFGLKGKRMTDSRISLLTGIQRRDVKVARLNRALPRDPETGLIPRVVAHWMANFSDETGTPLPLKPRGSGSFETVMHDISRDLHPRTTLDELVRRKLVMIGADGMLVLRAHAAILDDDEGGIAYFGANIGDHAAAATSNLIDPAAPAFLERAVHYDHLSPASVEALADLAEDLHSKTLETLNREAMRLQRNDLNAPDATYRFRSGAFVFHRAQEDH